MLKRDKVPDHVVDQKVGRQLASQGIHPPCMVTISSRNGTVTLSGKIQYEHQRNAAVRAARNVDGVQRVVDQLQVIPQASHWKDPASTAPRPHDKM
jgi:osmotically-inducible protein OsmY